MMRTKNFINLPKSCLQKGKNRVSILYQSIYDIDLSGFISFIDGGEHFLFTYFAPYFANRAFPCFDQPNLKATMKLTVVAPSKWRVLSNENPNSPELYNHKQYSKNNQWIQIKAKYLINIFSEKVGPDTVITTFPETKLLATYLFCLCAGNYQPIIT